MALETGSYISDLVITNPTGADAKSTSDDHHRLIKKTVKQSFPNVSGAVTASHTELSYVAGVTSAIQTQINAKASSASPTFTGTVVLPASTSIGTVSAAEILTLDGISSNIQSQIDLKAPLDSASLTGTPTAPTAGPGTNSTQIATTAFAAALSMAAGNMPVGGTTGQFLKKNSATNYDTVWTNPSVTRVARSSNTILAAADSGSLFDLSGTFTQTLTAAATLGSGWFCTLRNTSNGTITIDPNGSELIDGSTTFSLLPGYTVQLVCTGTAFTALVIKARSYLNVAQYTASNTFVVPQDVYVIRTYAFGSGVAGTAGSNSGGGGGCAYGDIAVTPGQTVTLSIVSGISVVQVSATTMLTANSGVGTAAGTASKHASVTNGGAFSGGAGVSAIVAGGGSSGSPLGAGVAGVTSGGGSGWGLAGVVGGGGGGVGASTGPNAAGDGLLVPSTDPLLANLTGKGGMNGFPSGSDVGGTGSDGGGGGKGEGTSSIGGNGGFGAGGGAATSTSGIGGAGGFGGGGGGGAQQGGAGGFGGGGGTGSTTGGAAGAAVIRIYY